MIGIVVAHAVKRGPVVQIAVLFVRTGVAGGYFTAGTGTAAVRDHFPVAGIVVLAVALGTGVLKDHVVNPGDVPQTLVGVVATVVYMDRAVKPETLVITPISLWTCGFGFQGWKYFTS